MIPAHYSLSVQNHDCAESDLLSRTGCYSYDLACPVCMFSDKTYFSKKTWDKKTAAPITEKLHVAINLRMNKYRNSSTSQRPAWKKNTRIIGESIF